MSYTVNNNVVNTANEDYNLLYTRRDAKNLVENVFSYQFEPGLVLDVLLNDSHPKFKNEKMGKMNDPQDRPINYNGEEAKTTDNSYFVIGSVLVRLCYSQQKKDQSELIWACPLDNSFSTFPLLNEIVHVVKIFDTYYYTNKVNTRNFSNTSADFRYEQTYGKRSRNTSYEEVTLTGPESKLDSTKNSNQNSFNGILGNYFWFNSRIRNLRRFEGDSVFESRFGQSIRMGSYDDNRSNDKGNYTDYKSGKDTHGGGNPMILIRNRQRPLTQDKKQTLHPLLNTISDISSSLNEKNVGGYMIEDINNDGSSIHITSGLTVSKFRTTCYKKYFSTDKQEEQLKFIPSEATKFKTPVFNKDQIVIHSDRLIFASRFNETMHFSKKRYMITTDSEYTVDAHDQIVLTTNQKTVINSPAIYLGEYNNTNEPALLGQTTVDWLYDLCCWLEEHVHHYEHSHSHSGEASPSDTQVPVQLQELRALRDRLHTCLSRRVFLTGGGYATGANGKSITDGVNPVSIENIDSEIGVSGIPGGWTGRSRRLDAVFDDETVSAAESQIESSMNDILEEFGETLSPAELTVLLSDVIDQSLAE